MVDTSAYHTMTRNIRKIFTRVVTKELVSQIISKIRSINPEVLTHVECRAACASQINYKICQYINNYQRSGYTYPDQIFAAEPPLNMNQTIQKSIDGESVFRYMDMNLKRLLALDENIIYNEMFNRCFEDNMRSMIFDIFNEIIPSFSSLNNEHIWVAIGKLATIIDNYQA